MALRGRHLGVALAVTAVGLLTLAYPLHGDVRHEVGVQAVSGHSAAATFSHRPLLFRLITSALAKDADLLTSTIPREVSDALKARFDCDRGTTLEAMVVCPRRTTDSSDAQPTR